METYSLNHVVRGLEKEKEDLADNWQGDVSSMYLQIMDHHIDSAKKIDKRLEYIFQELQELREIIESEGRCPVLEKKLRR